MIGILQKKGGKGDGQERQMMKERGRGMTRSRIGGTISHHRWGILQQCHCRGSVGDEVGCVCQLACYPSVGVSVRLGGGGGGGVSY